MQGILYTTFLQSLHAQEDPSCTSSGEARTAWMEKSICSLDISSSATTSRMWTEITSAFPTSTTSTQHASRTLSWIWRTSTMPTERIFPARPAWLGSDPLSTPLSIPPPALINGLSSTWDSWRQTQRIQERTSVSTRRPVTGSWIIHLRIWLWLLQVPPILTTLTSSSMLCLALCALFERNF